jgi:hypothetical protein
MNDLRMMVEVVNNTSDIHKKNSAKTARDHQLCAKYGNLAQLITIGIPMLYCVTVAITNLTLYFGIFTQGITQPTSIIYFPGVDTLNKIHMIVLFIFNIAYQYIFLAIVCVAESFIYMNFSTIPMFSTIIQRQIGDLSNNLKDKNNSKNLKLIKQQMIEVIEMQLKYTG